MENMDIVDEIIQELYNRGMEKRSIILTIVILNTEENKQKMMKYLKENPYANPGEIIGQTAIICYESESKTT